MGIRFLLAGGILLLIFSGVLPIYLAGLCVRARFSVFAFLVMTFELFGLETVSSSSAAF